MPQKAFFPFLPLQNKKRISWHCDTLLLKLYIDPSFRSPCDSWMCILLLSLSHYVLNHLRQHGLSCAPTCARPHLSLPLCFGVSVITNVIISAALEWKPVVRRSCWPQLELVKYRHTPTHVLHTMTHTDTFSLLKLVFSIGKLKKDAVSLVKILLWMIDVLFLAEIWMY